MVERHISQEQDTAYPLKLAERSMKLLRSEGCYGAAQITDPRIACIRV